MILEWCKSYDVLHYIGTEKGKRIPVWDRLTFCRYCCNRQKIEFYNNETGKRCKLSVACIEVICDDMYQYHLKTGHKELLNKIKEERS